MTRLVGLAILFQVLLSYTVYGTRTYAIGSNEPGARIAGGSLFSPSGFDSPFLPMQFIPVDYTSGATAQSTSATTFTATAGRSMIAGG